MHRYVLSAAVAAAIVAGPISAAAQDTVLRVSHQLPPAHHIARVVESWAADVEARSGNSIDVQIFGANQAFGARENFEAVATGQIEAALSVNFQWAGSVPAMNVTVVPYLFTDLDRIKAFPGSEASGYLDSLLADVGVRNLAWLYTTRQSIFTSKGRSLVDVVDFEGVKIRGLNRIADAGLAAAGAATVAMSGSEVYQALQTGVIDAGLTDVSAAYSRKYFEVQDHGTVAPFFSVYFHIYVNPDWFDGLTDAQRDAIQAASAEAERGAIEVTEATASAAIEQLTASGMTLHMQTDAEKAAWEAVMVQPVTDAFVEASGSTGQRIVELLNQL